MIRMIGMNCTFSMIAIIFLNSSLTMGEEFEAREQREHLQNRIDELQEEIRNALRNRNEDEFQELNELRERLIREHAKIHKDNQHEAEHSAQERQELVKRLGEMARESHELRVAGKHKEAEELQQELVRSMQERAESMKISRSKSEAHEIANRLRELEQDFNTLRRAGKKEEAERVMHELRELQQRSHRRPQPKHQIPEEKKIDHLHLAAENLEAGGFHEEAREFHQRAEQLREELERHLHEEHEHNDHEHHAEGKHREHVQVELIEQIEVMNKVMQQMQHQMRQTQEQLDHVRKELAQIKRPAPPGKSLKGVPYTPFGTDIPPENQGKYFRRQPVPKSYDPGRTDPSQPPLYQIPNRIPSTQAVPPGQPSIRYPQTRPPGTKFYPPDGDNQPSTPFGDPGQTLPRPPKNPKGDSDLYRPVPELREKKATPERKRQRDSNPSVKNEVKENIKGVKEVVLSMNSMEFMLDLDSGKTLDPPQTYRPEQRSMDIVPLQPQPSDQPVALMGNSLSGFKGAPADWDLSTNDLHKKLNIYPLSKLSKLTFDDSKTATYIYRTQDGAEGVLQLVELVDSPKGIRVRYRSLK